MSEPKKFGALRLREETLKQLRILKRAYEISYGKDFTNDDFVKQLAVSVEDGDVAVWETYCELKEKLDELKDRAEQRRQ